MKRTIKILSFCILLLALFGDITLANTGRAYMRIGRLWMTAEYDGAEGWSGQATWPGGHVRFPDSGASGLWGANVRKTGTVAGCKNWTGPNGQLYPYWTSGMYRTYDYDYPPYWREKTDLTWVFCVDQVAVQRWAPPKVFVDGVNIIADSGDEYTITHPTNTAIDPNLITERAIKSVWRYSMGVEYERWMYSYSNRKHQDYAIWDIKLTNNGYLYANLDEPLETWTNPSWPIIVEGQNIQDFWWSQTENPWNSNLGRSKSFGADDAVGEFITPWADQGNDRRFYLFYDGDHEGDGVKDWGDPSIDERWVELLSPAWIIVGALHADKGPNDSSDDLSQPNSTVIFHERKYDLGQIPKTQQDQYEAIFQPGVHWPLNTPHREIDAAITIPAGYTSFGPYDLAYNESINITYVWAAGGISEALCREYGKKAWDAGYTGPVMDEIEVLHKTGRDSVLKTLDIANWNVNGDKGGHPKFDVPDAPRPPASFSVAPEGAKIKIEWSDESRNDPDFDSGVKDFAGYRVYKATGARDSTYYMIYDGTDNEYYDTNVSPGLQYFYYLVAYDDGTQNWEDPGVSLESGKYYCWTGWAPEGVTPTVAPINSEAAMDDIRVVPNPYSAAGKTFPGEKDKILFTGLPATCTIKIFTSNGDFVHTIEHTDGSGTEAWDLRTEYNQYLVSDVYVYTVEGDLGDYVGKFIIIR